MRSHLAFAAALLAAPAAAVASPQDLLGYGPVSQSMGGLGATFADDYGAVHANPASLSRARERSFSIGYAGVGYSLYAQPAGAAREAFPVDVARATTIGLTLPLPFGGVLRDRIAIGLGFYTPTDVVVRGRILQPETPQFVVLADRTQSVSLQLGLGVDLGYGLRVGVGFAALAAIVGSVVIAPDATGRVGSRVDDQLVASYAPVVGASWDAGPFRAAVVYRGTLVGQFNVTIDATGIGIDLPRLHIAGVAQYDPQQGAAEVAYARGPWTLAAGVTFKRWSEYPGPATQTTDRSPVPTPPNFHDTWVARAGAEFRQTAGAHSGWALRAGYFFEQTPSPEQTGVTNYLDNDRHVVTAGAAVWGRLLGTLVRMDAFVQGHFLVERTAVKGADVPAGNPGAPSLTYGGTVVAAGLTATVSF